MSQLQACSHLINSIHSLTYHVFCKILVCYLSNTNLFAIQSNSPSTTIRTVSQEGRAAERLLTPFNENICPL